MDSAKRVAGLLTRASTAVVDAILPPLCLACRRPVARDGGLCPSCWQELRFIDRPYCNVLGTPFAYDIGTGAVSAEAIANPPAFDRARAACVHRGPARDLVHRLKYSDRADLARWMAGWMVRAGSDLLADADLLIPVPLYRTRLWSRRFNQAALLAHAIGLRQKLRVETEWLERIRATPSQVGLNAGQRERNVRGAFRIRKAVRPEIKARKIVLVDDVLTTGSTVDACARSLRRAGAGRVDVLVFARVVPGQDVAI
ncbi:MAG: ComF family protein [Pseudomonadota bacterium]